MAHITSIRFWSDPGYTEGCIEIPGLDYILPTPSFRPLSVNGWRPAKNALFDKIKVEESFPDLINMSFLEAVYLFEDGTEMMFYGWIDNVSILSDDTDHPVTTIDWHVDYWMTYRQAAVFKYGLVKRRKSDGIKPPQNPPYRFKKVNEIIPLVPTQSISFEDGSLCWVILNVIRDVGEQTEIRVACIPIELSAFPKRIRIDPEHTVSTISWNALLLGNFDEYYGIPPSNILSMYLSPIAPFPYTETNNIIEVASSTGWLPANGKFVPPQDNERGLFMWDIVTYSFSQEETVPLATPIETGDVTTYVITDFKGNAIGALPYGFRASEVSRRIINTSTGGYLQVRFHGWAGGLEGMSFNIPLPSFDVSTNSWSAYVYSGQKEYDAESKRLANEHALVQGGISALSGGMSGAVTGGLMGSLGGPLGTLGGALVGGLGEALGGLAATGLGFAENIRFTDEMIGALNEYHASQLESILIYGDTHDWVWHGKVPSLVSLEIDEYSQNLYNIEQTVLGAKVSEPTENCQPLIEAGGPLQIENLIVGGNIPARAKDYMRDRFRRGVRLL